MKTLFTLLVVLLCATSAYAQVAIDGTPQEGAVTSATNTISVTVAANSNLAMLAICHINNTTVSGVAWNTSENFAFIQSAASIGNEKIEFWGLTAPSTGTHDAVVTLAGSQENRCVIYSLYNVSQATPFSGATTEAYTGTQSTGDTNDTTCQTNGLVVDGLTAGSAMTSLTVNGGQTTIEGPTSDSNFISVESTKAGAASVTTGYTWDSAFIHWAHVTTCANPVGGGGGNTRSMLLGIGH